MSSSNFTPTINLPEFIGTDKPAWLVDWNGAMNTIDSAIATLQTSETGTASALAALSQSVTALSAAVEQQATSITSITQTLTTVVGNVQTINGNINTINELLGNGTPTTQDKTIIGAINELKEDIDGLTPGGAISAANVSYDNEDSGLTAENVQDAIDEIVDAIPSIVSTEEVQRAALAVGATTLTLTFTEQPIGTNTLVDVYTDVYGVNPTNVVTTANTVTLTFDAQTSTVLVGVKVQN